MIEFRFHSRGGQGGVIAGKLLAVAAGKEGKHVQSFPSFGVERRGAPVMTFVRIDDKPIKLRTQVYAPDILVVMDPSLTTSIPILQGLKPGGTVIVNSPHNVEHFDFPAEFKAYAVDASRVALAHKLGSITQPIVNTSMLGMVAGITGIVGIDSLTGAIREEIPVRQDDNTAAAQEAYHTVKTAGAE